MAIRLIDPNATKEVVVEGTVFHVRQQIDNGGGYSLVAKCKTLQQTDDGFNDLLRIVARHVVKIDGINGDPADVLVNMKSIKSQQVIIDAVMEAVELTGAESKNSNSSSGTQHQDSPGSDATPPDTETASTENSQ